MTETSVEARPTSSSVSVDIYDQTYHLRAPDPAYIEKLAAMVDAKMRAVSANGVTVDSLRVAVLAALNIADELARLQDQCRRVNGTVNETRPSCAAAPIVFPACWIRYSTTSTATTAPWPLLPVAASNAANQASSTHVPLRRERGACTSSMKIHAPRIQHACISSGNFA